MTYEQQPPEGRLIHALDFLKACEAVVSSLTIALTGIALGYCINYALGTILLRTQSWWLLVIALLLNSWMVPIMVRATTEDGLKELKRNRAFELALVVVTILKNTLSLIVLLRLVWYAVVLFSEKGVNERLPLWGILRRVFLG